MVKQDAAPAKARKSCARILPVLHDDAAVVGKCGRPILCLAGLIGGTHEILDPVRLSVGRSQGRP